MRSACALLTRLVCLPVQVRNEFYKDSQGVVLVYDVGARDSFAALDGWLGEMKQEMGSLANMDTIVFIVCANKVGRDCVVRVWSYDTNIQHFLITFNP